jgi:DNA-directed RNA polymerase specialized sigma24 family protein
MRKLFYTDADVLEGIFNRDDRVIKHLMKKEWSPIAHLINGFKGSNHDIMMVMEEAIIAIYSRSEKPELDVKFSTYFYAICKRIWLKELRKRESKEQLMDDMGRLEIAQENEIIDKHLFEKRRKLYLKYFVQISKYCQQVLRLVASGYSNDQITSELSFSSVQYTRNRKRECNQRLVEMIKADPDYSNLCYGL